MILSGDGEWAAVPGVDPSSAGHPEDEPSTLEVDGEVFELRPDGSGGTHYSWVSGPHAGYGFTMSPTTESPGQHELNIRNFLSMVDPVTGYIEDR